MKQIQKLCDEKWKRADVAGDHGRYAVWHEAFIAGFKLCRAMAADLTRIEVEPGKPIDTRMTEEIRRLGEENV